MYLTYFFSWQISTSSNEGRILPLIKNSKIVYLPHFSLLTYLSENSLFSFLFILYFLIVTTQWCHFFILSDLWPAWTIISYYLALMVSFLLYLWLSVASRPDSHYSLIWYSSKLNLSSFLCLSLGWCFYFLSSDYLVLHMSLLVFFLLPCFMFSYSYSFYNPFDTFSTYLDFKSMTFSCLVF